MNAMATRPGNRKGRGLAGAGRRRPETKTGGREARRAGASFAVLGVSLFCCATLAACGGGGGGGSGASGGVAQFNTSFSQLAGVGSSYNGTVETPSQVVFAGVTETNTGGQIVTRVDTPVSESAVVRIRVQNGTLRSFDLRGQGVNANFPNQDLEGNIMDPIAAGHEYQTFGWWSGVPSATASRSWGAVSFGRRTEAANLPDTQATYAAKSVGLQTDHGNAYSTTSDISISTADYTNVTISSTNTMRAEIMPDGNSGPETRAVGLDFTGTGAVTGSGFEANISERSIVNPRTGMAVGWFYGPNAEEVGGTFNLGWRSSHYIGAFGGKKQ